MTTMTVFELAQLEAEENVWIPTKATKFITRLLTRRHLRSKARSATEEHVTQNNKPSDVRMTAASLPPSRQRYSTSRNDSSSKVARTKKNQGNSRSAQTFDKVKPNK
jgi:hypothetical protein